LGLVARLATANRPIAHQFDDFEGKTAQLREFFSRRSIIDAGVPQKIRWRTFPSAVACLVWAAVVRFKQESQMAWKAPKIVEVSVGMEINMYMCATRK